MNETQIASTEEKRRCQELGKPIMLAVFYAMFDEPAPSDEACVLLISTPDAAVARFLCEVLRVVDINATVRADGAGAGNKLEVHAGDLDVTRTKIMLYFAHEANKVREVRFRMPGAHWRPPANKAERDYTVRELMFARSYGKDIPPDQLDRVLAEAANYDDEFARVVCS
jgi:hypothetical protein